MAKEKGEYILGHVILCDAVENFDQTTKVSFLRKCFNETVGQIYM